MVAIIGSTIKSLDPYQVAKDERTSVIGTADTGRLERNVMSTAKVTGRPAGWLREEIPHNCPIVMAGSPLFPFDNIFQEMKLKDADLASFNARFNTAIVTLPRNIVPRDSSDGAKEAVDLCEKQVQMLEGGGDILGGNQWIQSMFSLLNMVWAGTAFVEPNWNDDFFIDELIERPMHAFGFKETESGGARLCMRRPGYLEEIPPGKIIFARNSISNYPWGDPMAAYVYWIWKSKIYNWMDWALFLERWAKPYVDMEYEDVDVSGGSKESLEDNSTTESDNRLAMANIAAAGIWGGGKFVHNQHLNCQIKNQSVTGGEQFRQYYQMCAQQESRLLLSEITLAGLEAGSYKKAEIVQEVGKNRMYYYAPSLSSIIENTIFKWIVQTHLPRAPVPRLMIDVTSTEGRKAIYEGVEAALNWGQDVAIGDARRAWGTREPFPNEPIINKLMTKETLAMAKEAAGDNDNADQ